MAKDLVRKVSPKDLGILISTLEVHFVWLSHCLVSPGFRLEMGGNACPGIHYNIQGKGRLLVTGQEAIDLEPHTLVVVPANSPFRIEVPGEEQPNEELETVKGGDVMSKKKGIYQFIAGNPREARINLVCGFFRASYGQTTDLFAGLNAPIVEKFGPDDQIDVRLRSAVGEFLSHEVGSDAMSGALLKEVIILLLRRSLVSINLWVERFSILRDPRIARVFAAMVADPGGAHTVKSLAGIALMSRSAFMVTFTEILGKSPMAILRDLRMRHASRLLKYSYLSVDQVARESGYDSKTSFTRAFKEAYGKYPNDYRAELSDAEPEPVAGD
jgi:AraC family transcriptional activator of mtrCDE